MTNSLFFPIQPFYLIPMENTYNDSGDRITLQKPYRVYAIIDHGTYKEYLIRDNSGFPYYLKHHWIRITRFPLYYRFKRFFLFVKGVFT